MSRGHLSSLVCITTVVTAGRAVAANTPTLEQMRSAVKESIESHSVAYDAPALSMLDGKLVLRLGGLKRQHVGARTPLDYPLEAMYTVELMRRDLAPQVTTVDWNATFRQADSIIEKELKHIRTHTRKPEALRRTLDADHEEFIATFERSVGQNGPITVLVPKAAALYEVAVKTDPPDGLRFYLTVLEYKLLQISGGLGDETNWHEIVTPTVTLGGNFHFRGHWRPNKVHVTGVVSIDSTAPVTITEGS